jgi:Ala-tRNA(Pro) deacylase
MDSSPAAVKPDASSVYEDSLPTSSLAMLSLFDRLGIDYDLHNHPPLRTVSDSQQLRGSMEGAHIKNLYLRNSKKKNFLVVAEETLEIDLKSLGDEIGGNRFSFGSADRLMEFLGVRPGAVSPLTLINDPDHQVTLVIDRAILDADKVNLHPLVNDKTVTISTTDLIRFLEHTGHFADCITIGSTGVG